VYCDVLIGLWNWCFFDEELGCCYVVVSSEGILLMIVIIDVDYFKCINDELLYECGDVVLCMLGCLFEDVVGVVVEVSVEVFVGWFGGEEFVLIMFGVLVVVGVVLCE